MIDTATYSSIEVLHHEWEALADRLAAPPFLRPGWIDAWWRAFGTGNLEVLATRTNGRLEGVFPLLRHRNVTRSTSNWHTPLYGVLAGDRVTLATLTRELFDRDARQIWLGFLDGDAVELGILRSAAEKARYRVLVRTLERSPYLILQGDWLAFERGIKPRVRTDLRRRVRRLEEQGRLVLDIRDGTEQLEELLLEGFEIEPSGWKAAGGSSIAARRETELFYSDVAQWAARRGWLRLAYLRLDGRAVAFQYSLQHDGIWYHLKGGYDPAYQRFSPGRILVRAVLEHCFSAGLLRYEFLGGAEPFKLEWTTTSHERVLVQAFAPSVAGLVGWSGYAYGRPLAKRLRESTQRLLKRR